MSNKTRLTYRGDVAVRLKIGSKVIDVKGYNSGTAYLKKSICKFLSGNYGGAPDIPQMIDLRKKDSSMPDVPASWKTCLNQEIILTGKTFLIEDNNDLGINNNWVARFTAAIPRAALIDAISADDVTNSYRLYLYGSFDELNISERYHDLAYIDISAESLSRITPGTQALIEWSMQILNYGEVQGE